MFKAIIFSFFALSIGVFVNGDKLAEAVRKVFFKQDHEVWKPVGDNPLEGIKEDLSKKLAEYEDLMKAINENKHSDDGSRVLTSNELLVYIETRKTETETFLGKNPATVEDLIEYFNESIKTAGDLIAFIEKEEKYKNGKYGQENTAAVAFFKKQTETMKKTLELIQSAGVKAGVDSFVSDMTNIDHEEEDIPDMVEEDEA